MDTMLPLFAAVVKYFDQRLREAAEVLYDRNGRVMYRLSSHIDGFTQPWRRSMDLRLLYFSRSSRRLGMTLSRSKTRRG